MESHVLPCVSNDTVVRRRPARGLCLDSLGELQGYLGPSRLRGEANKEEGLRQGLCSQRRSHVRVAFVEWSGPWRAGREGNVSR
jgi:hypothetical protein